MAGSAAQVPATQCNDPSSVNTHTSRIDRQGRDNKHSHGWRRLVRHASPQLFTITMGSGITALLLNVFPYPADWLFWLAVVVFCLHILLVSLFTLASVLRFTLYPDLFSATLTHWTESLYLGAFPVSLLSLSNLIASLCTPSWGPWAAYTAWGVWMAASFLAVLLAAHIPLLHFPPASAHCPHHRQRQGTPTTILQSVTPAHCLPAIAAIVAANTAAPIANALPTTSAAAPHATATVIAGYVLWGIGLPTSLLVLGLYFARLMLSGRLARPQAVAALITIGPLNMGATGAVQLGSAARTRFAATRTLSASAGDTLYAAGVLFGLVLWGWALVWLWWAAGNIDRELFCGWRWRRRRRNSNQDSSGSEHSNGFLTSLTQEFNMSWWSAIFPLGTMGLSSGRLGQELPSAFFRVVGAMVSVLVFVLFLGIGALTLCDLAKSGGRRVFASGVIDERGKEKERERARKDEEEGEGLGDGTEHREGDGDGDGEVRTLTNEDSREAGGRRRGGGAAGSMNGDVAAAGNDDAADEDNNGSLKDV